MKNKFYFFMTLFFLFDVFGNTLFDLEKLRSENESQKSALYSQIEDSRQKIEINKAAIQQKKVELAKYLRADRQLHKFQFGGLMAVEDLGKLQRNLKIFEKLKQQNLMTLRELKFYADDLEREKKYFLDRTHSIEKLNRSIFDQEAALNDLEKKTLTELIHQKKDSLLLLKGTLAEPVLKSKLTAQFGFFADSKNEYGINHKGLTYQTSAGLIVQAVGPGKIIFRDQIKHWGESVIVQHVGDYYSVYTDLKNVQVDQDQTISTAEHIGETASAEFYFELRNKTIAINPKNWIRELK